MESKNHLSLTVQAAYLLLTGLQLIFVPNMLLGKFGFEPTTEIWVKVLGCVLLALAITDYSISKHGNRPIVLATVWARLTVAACFVLLVLAGQTKPALILFAGIDIATAAWTWFELKK